MSSSFISANIDLIYGQFRLYGFGKPPILIRSEASPLLPHHLGYCPCPCMVFVDRMSDLTLKHVADILLLNIHHRDWLKIPLP